jgi:hypothetical protein
MLPYYTERTALPIGLSYETAQPVLLQLQGQNRMLISGETIEQATKALKAVAQLLHSREDNQVWILDGDGSLCDILEGAPNLMKFSGMNSLCHGVNSLYYEIEHREQELIALENTEDEVDTVAFAKQYPQICILIHQMHLVMEKLSEDARTHLENLCAGSGNLGVIVIGAAQAADIGSYMCTEKLTILLVNSPDTTDASTGGTNYQKGLCIGGKLRNHDSFQQLSDTQKAMLLENGDAAVLDCGTVTRIKTIG